MRESEIKAMIAALRKIEDEQHLNLKGLAKRLGYSVGQVSMVFAGKRGPGLRFVRAVIECFPEIRYLLADSLDQPQTEQDGTGSER